MRRELYPWLLVTGSGVGIGLLALILARKGLPPRLSAPPKPRRATFTKVADEWGAKVIGPPPQPGDPLRIVRKDQGIVRGVVREIAREGEEYAIVLVDLEEKPKRRRPLQRMRELVEYVRENPGQRYDDYIYWAAEVEPPLRRRVSALVRDRRLQQGGRVLDQAVDRGLVQIVVDETIPEGLPGRIKVYPAEASLPATMRPVRKK